MIQVDSTVDWSECRDNPGNDVLKDPVEHQKHEGLGSNLQSQAVEKKVTKRHRNPKSMPPPATSLHILDATLPAEPRFIRTHIAREVGTNIPQWLEHALDGTIMSKQVPMPSAASDAAAATLLTARLAALTKRMRTLLRKHLYGRGRHGPEGDGNDVGMWAEEGRPAGFLGAGLAEELCSAVFARIQGLRDKGVGKQVRCFEYLENRHAQKSLVGFQVDVRS